MLLTPGALMVSANTRRVPLLSGLGLSVVCELDATQPSSYPGNGQNWFNMEPAPADNSAQSDCHAFLGNTIGADATDPVYDPGLKGFLCGGNDYATLPDYLNTALAEAHRIDKGPFFAVTGFSTPSSGATNQRYCGNKAGSFGHGWQLESNGFNNAEFLVNQGEHNFGVSGTNLVLNEIDYNKDHICVATWDWQLSSNNCKGQVNNTNGGLKTRTPIVIASPPLGSQFFTLMAADESGDLEAGMVFRYFAFGLGFLTDEQMGAIIAFLSGAKRKLPMSI